MGINESRDSFISGIKNRANNTILTSEERRQSHTNVKEVIEQLSHISADQMLYLNNVAELGGHLSGHSCDADRTVESMSGSNSEHILDERNLDNTTTTSILRKDYLGTSIDFTLEDIPQTYEDALASPESDYWKAAIENEVKV